MHKEERRAPPSGARSGARAAKRTPVTQLSPNTTALSASRTVAQRRHQNAEPESQRPTAILCIDDDPVILHLQCALLEAAGFVVTSATEPAKALRAFTMGVPDAVVVDYSMPGMNGAAMAAHLRRVNRDVPLILNTGCTTVPAADAALFDRILAKGMAPGLLLGVLREMFPLSPFESSAPRAKASPLPLRTGLPTPQQATVESRG
jgi:CheY-like chemotaxis protein